MGYNATCSGTITVKSKFEKAIIEDMKKYAEDWYREIPKTIFDIPSPEEYPDDIEIEFVKDTVVITVYGSGKYCDESWYDWLEILKPYMDFDYDNSIEFSGEDGQLWRFRVDEDGIHEEGGYICYREKYVVVIDSSYAFVGVYEANKKEEAIARASKESGYSPLILSAIAI